MSPGQHRCAPERRRDSYQAVLLRPEPESSDTVPAIARNRRSRAVGQRRHPDAREVEAVCGFLQLETKIVLTHETHCHVKLGQVCVQKRPKC